MSGAAAAGATPSATPSFVSATEGYAARSVDGEEDDDDVEEEATPWSDVFGPATPLPVSAPAPAAAVELRVVSQFGPLAFWLTRLCPDAASGTTEFTGVWWTTRAATRDLRRRRLAAAPPPRATTAELVASAHAWPDLFGEHTDTWCDAFGDLAVSPPAPQTRSEIVATRALGVVVPRSSAASLWAHWLARLRHGGAFDVESETPCPHRLFLSAAAWEAVLCEASDAGARHDDDGGTGDGGVAAATTTASGESACGVM